MKYFLSVLISLIWNISSLSIRFLIWLQLFLCSLYGHCNANHESNLNVIDLYILVLGLLTATVSSEVFKAAQPALLYLVPFTLLPLMIMAYLKVNYESSFCLICLRLAVYFASSVCLICVSKWPVKFQKVSVMHEYLTM